MIKKVKIIFVLLFVILAINFIHAQENIESMKKQLKRSGLTETQAQNWLKNYGFIVTKELQEQGYRQGGLSFADSIRLAKQQEFLYPGQTMPELLPVEDTLHIEKLYPYGYEIFRYSPSYAEPFIDYGVISDEYPVGPGDEIILSVWGDDQLHNSYSIDRNGSIYIDKLGKIYISNIIFRDLKEFLKNRLKTIYSGIEKGSTNIDVTLGRLRKVKVFVTGEVMRPSDYYVNTLTDVINLIYKSGGITEVGNMREVRLIRDGKTVRTFDMYKFLIGGKFEKKEKFQDYDVVYIPFVGKSVAIKGEIKRPAIYQLNENEKINDLIKYAGGFKSSAYLKHFNIESVVLPSERKEGGADKEIISFYDLDKFYSHVPADGDTVFVFKIKEEKKNYVSVVGRVKKGGDFEYYPGLLLNDVLKKAGGLEEDAYTEKLVIIRTNPDSTLKLITPNYEDILSNKENIELAPLDRIVVSSIWDFEEKPYVEIYGEVRDPGIFPLMEDMTIKDLIHLAGGLKENAYKYEALISRLIPDSLRVDSRKTSQIHRIELKHGITENSGETFTLQKFDNIFIRENPDFIYPKKVYLYGELKYPSVYPLLSENERITDLLERAGGFTKKAYLDGISFYRKQNEIGRISINFEKILKNPGHTDNLFMVEEDSLYVPEKINTVRVTGAVGLPVSVLFIKGKGVSYYIKSAGGYLDDADKGKIQIMYPNGQLTAPKKFWFDPPIKPGSTIMVPKKPVEEKRNWTEFVSNWVQIIASLATTIYILKNIQ